MKMKKNQMHNILESINRGIRIALDDYDYNELNGSISHKSNVIQGDNFIKERIELDDLVRKLAYYVNISEEEFIKLSQLAKKYNYKYSVKNKDELKRIVNYVGNKSYFVHMNEFNENLLKVDLNFLDVSNITSMSELFKDNDFNGDISKWDVSNVTDMNGMFRNSHFNGNISNWDVSNVKYLNMMFTNSIFDQDISNWNCKTAISYMDAVEIKAMFARSPLEDKAKIKYWPKLFQPK